MVWHDLYTRSYAVLASSEGLRVTGTVQANYGVFSIIASEVERANFSENNQISGNLDGLNIIRLFGSE